MPVQMIKDNLYSASFTAGGLLYPEICALLDILMSDDRENLLQKELEENKLLKINSEKSRKRIIHEIKKRLKKTDIVFWDYFKNHTEKEKRLLLFYLSLKTYRLVFDFHFNVTVEKFKGGISKLDPYYYQMWMDQMASTRPEVDKWATSTRKKLISVYLVMLKAAGMVKEMVLSPVHVEDNFWCYFIEKNDPWFLEACLLKEDTRKRLIKSCL